MTFTDKDSSYGLDFRPTRNTPALQYLSDVYVNGVADRAGLKIGDYLLRVRDIRDK